MIAVIIVVAVTRTPSEAVDSSRDDKSLLWIERSSFTENG